MRLARYFFVNSAAILLVLTSSHYGIAEDPQKAPDKPSCEIKIQLKDENGRPVVGAAAGRFFGVDPEDKNGGEMQDGAIADDKGIAVLRIDAGRKPPNRIFARHHVRQLVAIGKLALEDFKDGVASIELTMAPECWVSGSVSCAVLEQRNGTPTRAYRAYVDYEGISILASGSNTETTFRLPLPPGRFVLDTYTKGTHSTYTTIEIKSGQREIDLGILQHEPKQLALLEGKPAPEVDRGLVWKNSPPLKLEEFRGKVVLLEFWGWWCGPCVRGSIPQMMKLQKQYAGQDLVIIGVHSDTENNQVKDPSDLDVKLQSTREKFWGGKDITFPIVLIPAKRTPFGPKTTDTALNELCAKYGVDSFPTTILIDKQGNVVGEFRPTKPEQLTKLEQLIKSEYCPTVATENAERDKGGEVLKR